MKEPLPTRSVAIIGGATAGSEVASRLAERGILVAVFEQNTRPYGKIEDGLPRWHHRLRDKEYESVQTKLSHPLIHFVPRTKIGRDIDFEALVNDWGFTCVVLANGAWRDRSLPIEGAQDYVDSGLVYQNPYVIAFNHADDPQYSGQRFEIQDGSMVIGGGLASIDVAKIVTLSCTQRALAERGIEVAINNLEVKGIPKTLAAHDVTWEELGLEGCCIYYRRRQEDMPLVAIPDGATAERIEKVKKSRTTVLTKACEKFKLKIEPLSAPDDLIVEDGRLVGIQFRRTRIEDGRVIALDETYERRAPVVLSSIGSIPEGIGGVGMKGELFDFTDWTYGRLADYPSVFSVGNVVTGKGNIVASRKHATQVSREAVEAYLGVSDREEDANVGPDLSHATEMAEGVIEHATRQAPASSESVGSLLNRIGEQQKTVGYGGELAGWLKDCGDPC